MYLTSVALVFIQLHIPEGTDKANGPGILFAATNKVELWQGDDSVMGSPDATPKASSNHSASIAPGFNRYNNQ